MHGIVHIGLRRYVMERHGQEIWNTVLAEAGVTEKFYLVVEAYPDDDVIALVDAAARITGISAEAIHEKLGEFLVPDFLRLGRALIRPHWKTYDFLLNVETTMHEHVRRRVEGAKPPVLYFEPIGTNRLRLHYQSPRRMIGVAKGLVRGFATHFGESATLDEHRADDGSSVIDIQIH